MHSSFLHWLQSYKSQGGVSSQSSSSSSTVAGTPIHRRPPSLHLETVSTFDSPDPVCLFALLLAFFFLAPSSLSHNTHTHRHNDFFLPRLLPIIHSFIHPSICLISRPLPPLIHLIGYVSLLSLSPLSLCLSHTPTPISSFLAFFHPSIQFIVLLPRFIWRLYPRLTSVFCFVLFCFVLFCCFFSFPVVSSRPSSFHFSSFPRSSLLPCFLSLCCFDFL